MSSLADNKTYWINGSTQLGVGRETRLTSLEGLPVNAKAPDKSDRELMGRSMARAGQNAEPIGEMRARHRPTFIQLTPMLPWHNNDGYDSPKS